MIKCYVVRNHAWPGLVVRTQRRDVSEGCNRCRSWPCRIVCCLADAPLGHTGSGSRFPRGWPDTLRAAWSVLAELGRARVRRPGQFNGLSAERGRGLSRRGAGFPSRPPDEWEVHPEGTHRHLSVPHPDVVQGPARHPAHRHQGGQRRGPLHRRRAAAPWGVRSDAAAASLRFR